MAIGPAGALGRNPSRKAMRVAMSWRAFSSNDEIGKVSFDDGGSNDAEVVGQLKRMLLLTHWR